MFFPDIVDMSKMSADQRRRLKELAASMSDEGKRQRTPPRFADDYGRNRPVDDYFRPPPLPSSFRRPDYVPQHSATLSHPAGPAYPPMRSGGYEVSKLRQTTG